MATNTSAPSPPTYQNTCSGASDPNYTITYVPGATTVISPPPPPPPPPAHGYWLVGSDGGIFTFGSATFHGSTGNLKLQRPVVGITPTASQGGYWLVASDGGIFAFGDAGFYGSIPGLGMTPNGFGTSQRAQRANRRHGPVGRRRRLFHGRHRRRRLRLR